MDNIASNQSMGSFRRRVSSGFTVWTTLNLAVLRGIYVFILLTCALPLCAASSEEAPSAHDWDVRIGFPFWGAGLDGTVGVRDREARVDEDFTDVFDILDFFAPLNIEARRGRGLFFANGLYVKTSTDAEPGGLLSGLIDEVELEQKQVLLDFGVGYNLIPQRPFSLEAFVGGRLQYLDTEISADLPGSSTSLSDSKTWVDPIIGLIARYRFNPTFVLYAEADVGGFGVSSDLTWQAQGGLEWNIARHLYLRGGYRHLDTDFGDDDFEYNLEQSGPLLEIGLRF